MTSFLFLVIFVIAACASVASADNSKVLPFLGDDVLDNDLFGYATSVFGNVAAVSSFNADSGVGSVYMFEFSPADGTWAQSAKLVPFDPNLYANFGNSLSLYENRLAIGAWGDDRDGQTNIGAVYIYDYVVDSATNSSAWTFTQKLDGSGLAQSEFGTDVSLFQDRLLVGSVSYKNWMGCAYIYTLKDNSWVVDKQLIASDAYTGGITGDAQMYGSKVSLYGDIAIVAAPQDKKMGSVYVYEYNSGAWTETKIVASGLAETDLFGHGVALYEKTLVIGANGDDTPAGVNAGSVYVYQKGDNGWAQITQILADDAAVSDTFGTVVAISEKFIVATAPYKTNTENNVAHQGATYVYTIDYTSNVVTPLKKLISDDPLTMMNGFSVSVFDEVILVGVECYHTTPIPLYYNLLEE